MSEYRLEQGEVRPIGIPDPNNELSDLFDVTQKRLTAAAQEQKEKADRAAPDSAPAISRKPDQPSPPLPPFEGPEPTFEIE